MAKGNKRVDEARFREMAGLQQPELDNIDATAADVARNIELDGLAQSPFAQAGAAEEQTLPPVAGIMGQDSGAQTNDAPVQHGFVPSAAQSVRKMTQERISKAMDTLLRYKAGKAHLESRLVEVEQWWKLRHWGWMQEQGAKGDMQTTSAWLFNVIVSKHADGIQSIPEANILPREEGDKETAKQLSDIIPCVLEENGFDSVYSDVLWQKLKGGTGAYGVYWDPSKLNGLGDIAIKRINLLHLFWEPGVDDIQDSQNVFHVEPMDKEMLKQRYPQLEGEALSRPMSLRKFISEDRDNEADKAYVVDWYYHSFVGGKRVLHYCKFVGDVVLYASEDEVEYAERGFYDHALYPFVLDALFPVEGSPCGFGYIDVCKAPQEQIDILNQAVVRNALVNASPRYFVSENGGVNEKEFADYTKPFVHVSGAMGNESIVPIVNPGLDGNCVAVINNKINELKETSGNTDSSNGAVSSTMAASAIAALQEASGKTSRASTLSAYRAFTKIVNQIIELIRQFYDMPRQFRILGEMGEEQYMSFDNSAMQPQAQGQDFGIDMGYRLPVFDVKVSAQTKTGYNKNSQNELALNLYAQGVFNPQMTDQALMLLDMMDFDGKDEIMQKVSQNGTLMQQMAMYQQIALQLASQVDPAMADQIASGIMGGGAAPAMPSGGNDVDTGADDPGGAMTKLQKARERSDATRTV